MKTTKQLFSIILLAIMLFGCAGTHQIATKQPEESKPEISYYGIEVNGVLCGYLESNQEFITMGGRNMMRENEHIFLMLTLLGSNVNTEMKMQSLVDPETKECSGFTFNVSQGDISRRIEIKVENNMAFITSSMVPETSTIKMTPDILFGNHEIIAHLKKDFIEGGATEKRYRILEGGDTEVQESVFKKLGTEKLQLAGKTYDAVIFHQTNQKTGLKIKQWLNPDCDELLKLEVSNRKVFLADHTVVDKIKVADMDESIFTSTNESIGDIHAITYMKLKAKIEPTGVHLQPEDLNIPGQRFTGTVTDNLIEGIFEIEHKKYNGENAPPFPAEYKQEDSLGKYLTHERMIESNDSVLIEKAKEITEGAKDSWEAAHRLSKWVAENIAYAIPGGVTARKTYDIKAGECGAHSCLLAAFCRAVGIPARVVWGSMYAPNRGGGFGQHGWNEIYMGDAGWIPVDATAFENDFVDSGHIRIAELQSTSTAFNGKEIEILDYRLGDEPGETPALAENEKYSPYLGKYTNMGNNRVIEVMMENKGLVVDIPGQVKLPINNPDEKEIWFCKLTNKVYFTFKKTNNKIVQMNIHETASLNKNEDVTSNESIPEEYHPYMGKYKYPALNADFEIMYKDDGLALKEPRGDVIPLITTEERVQWLSHDGLITLFFKKDENGKIKTMEATFGVPLRRGEPAALVVERIIESSGIEEGLSTYHELKQDDSADVIFYENSFNSLGYRLIEKDKITDAIEVFKLNVEAYPESWNVYDSLGEAYMKNRDKELAIVNYNKSLELNPNNDNAKKMLEKIKSGE